MYKDVRVVVLRDFVAQVQRNAENEDKLQIIELLLKHAPDDALISDAARNL